MKTFLLCLFCLLLLGCAEQRALEGGPRDTQPPRLDSSKYSTPNGITSFREKEIILTFNEWIELKDVFNQVLISPPLVQQPEIKVKRKSVVLRFKEKLRDSTTYTINFGTAIQDYNEGNAAENFRFVFSTGLYLDSLKVLGQVYDLVQNKPMKGVTVMLYDALGDSIPALERPFYATKTNDQGQFELLNLKQDSFQLFALLDQNNNYRYDLPNEQIGFVEQPFWLGDSTQRFLRLKLFSPILPLQVMERRQDYYGFLQLKFSQPVDSLRLCLLGEQPSNFGQSIERVQEDSLIVWYRGDWAVDSIFWELQVGDWRDTLGLDISERQTFLAGAEGKPQWEKTGSRNFNKTITASLPNARVNEALTLGLHYPLRSLDSSKCQVLSDSSDTTHAFRLLLERERFLSLSLDKAQAGFYRLRLLPGALESQMGLRNTDTLVQRLKWNKAEEYGLVVAKIKNADSTEWYRLELVEGGQKIKAVVFLQGASSYERRFEGLLPGNYTLRLVHDENRNGRWDSGSFVPRRQPEPITTSKGISLRANWENEMEVDLAPPKGKFD